MNMQFFCVRLDHSMIGETQTFLDRSKNTSDNLSALNDDETITHRLLIHRNFFLLMKFRSQLIRNILYVFLFIIYSICIINIYDYFFIQPDFSSRLISSSYACHDIPSCSSKVGLLTNRTTIKSKNLSKHAFFSALYTENYLLGALILGYTIKKYHPNYPMYMLHFHDRLQNETTRCALQMVGWKLMTVKRIPPVSGVNKKFIDQVRI
jgi:hypothetical protein